MDDFAIKVEKINKVFKLPHEKNSSIKSNFVNVFSSKKGYELQEALKDISFEVKKGDFFGIVGRNGSGKSTLLKLLAGIYSPTSGLVHVRGTLTPFIELGVGFNPELTGRENIFLNGALLGFNRKEMQSMYKDIVEFAELERFMDQKLKNYSSGMQVRLAFSIAIRAQSDILLLDEVLAVGDAAFQQKSLDVFERYKAQKRTVVLVTHDMETVRRFCNKAMLIDSGKIIEFGEPNHVATKYSRINREVITEGMEYNPKSSPIKIKIQDVKGNPAKSFKTGEVMSVTLSWPKELKNVLNLGVAIVSNSGEFMFGANTLNNKKIKIERDISYQVELSLGPGKYYLMAGLFGNGRDEVIEFLDKGPEFLIVKDDTDTSDGVTRLVHKWVKDD